MMPGFVFVFVLFGYVSNLIAFTIALAGGGVPARPLVRVALVAGNIVPWLVAVAVVVKSRALQRIVAWFACSESDV